MKRILFVVAITLLVVGCSTTRSADLQVKTTYDAGTDFSGWKTFRFSVSTSSDSEGHRYLRFDKEIRAAIEENLEGRGYRRLEDGVPDFRIAFSFTSRGDHGSDMDRQYANEPTTSTRTRPTKTNTLVIKMLNTSTSEVLWEGQVTGFNLDAVQHQAEFRKAVWRLFVEFPPITR
jgi:hypothetical protein